MGGKEARSNSLDQQQVKDTVEGTYHLDINRLKGVLQNIDESYIQSWRKPNPLIEDEVNEIRLIVKKEGLLLDYIQSDDKYNYLVRTDWTNCNYGGKRPWFLCPRCNKRVAKLHAKYGYFLCRTCQNLNYRSSQTSDTNFYRISQRMKRIAARLKIEDYKIHEEPPWEKPKGMHWKTFLQLYEELMWLYHMRILALERMYEEEN